MNNIQNKGKETSAIPRRRSRVVIVGAGFGGIYAAKALRKASVQPTTWEEELEPVRS